MKNGWEIKKLGDLTDFITKGTTPTSLGHSFVPSGVNFVKVESIEDSGEFIAHKLAHITNECHEILKRSQLNFGDILFSIAGALGRTAFVTEDILPANTNQALSIIRLKKSTELLPAFILLSLSSGFVLEQVEKFKGGVAQQNLSLAQVRAFNIPIPSRQEQQRIVAILDEAFEGIATAKANAEKNLKNARQLFESHLNSVFSQRGEGWVEKRVEDICVLQRGLDLPSRLRVCGKFPLVSSSGVIDTHNKGPIIGPGVVTGRSGSIGSVFYIEEDYWPLNTVLYVKEFHGNDPKLVYWFLNYFDLKRFATGAGVPTLNRNIVHDECSYFPDFKIGQKQIVQHLDSLFEETKRLESIYQKKMEALDALRKSILQKAFSGKL